MSPNNRTHDDLIVRQMLVGCGIESNPDDIIRLLESMAQGTQYRGGADVILGAAANMIKAYHRIATDLA